VLVEVLLQLLIGQVDAELLERVRLERLEPVDVEHADEGGAVGVLPAGAYTPPLLTSN
jgi:hypothetical protein